MGTNRSNLFMRSFVRTKFSSVTKGDDERRSRSAKILSLGMPPAPQEISKETQASKLRDAPVHPLLHQQLTVPPS